MRSFLLGLATILSASAFAQQAPEWELLPDSPFHGYRSEDVFFVDADYGWAVNGSGEIHRTIDGGDTWAHTDTLPGYARSTGFANRNKGWVGLLFTSNILFETTDGGLTFNDITSRIQPAVGGGICGMWVVDEQIAYGVGQFSGPAYLIKTTDGGQTWASSDLGAYADTAVDVMFLDADHGFIAAGGSGSVRVLETTDGGATWSIRHTSSVSGVWGWKLSFPTENVGYVSAEYGSGTSKGLVLRTADGGQTWTEITIPNGGSLQGVGFLTPEIGWTSGRGTTSVTTDGGQTWQQIALDGDINRFRFLGDSLGFAAGHQIYRLGPLPVSKEEPLDALVSGLESIVPNPASGPITITYRMARPGPATIAVFDLLGRAVAMLGQGMRSAGTHVVMWEPSAEGWIPAAGKYIVRLQTEEGASARLITLTRR
ncbi:MAG: T9SS type A sorting domain-containing protein [Bacteroidetes bacterium]|nr:T9SS type A sorting domain-containing protein [Bacteroidota bacterium]